jgi:hypothetical protein
MPLMSIPAHYDGVRVCLDEEVALRPNVRLIVTVLEDSDAEREDFLRLAASKLAAAYADDEVEYSVADLRQ